MLNLSQSSLMVEGCLRGIMNSQEGKSFEEIVGYAKYVMGENKIAKLDEEVYKPDVEVGVDSIVDILISNMEMKWTEDDVYKIEEKDLFTDISKMNERHIVKVNNELGRKRTQPKAENKQQKAESKKAAEQKQEAKEEKQPKQEAKEEKKAEEQPKQEAKTDSFRDILIKVNDELVRKRREEAKQKAESKKVDEQKQEAKEEKKAEEPKQEAKEEKKAETKEQPKAENKQQKAEEPKQEAKEEKKAETKDIRQKLIDLINCKTIYNLIPNQEKGSFEEFKKQNQEIELEKIEDTNVLEMIDLIKEMSDRQYDKFKNNIHNAKSEQDILKAISEIEMDIIAEKARTFEGFISVIKDEFKIKNLTEDEMLTMYDIFYKAVEDNEAINDALDKALDRINQKVNQKINRIEKDKSINESEERWLRYFHLNLKNKKRGTMKAFLYKKCELYENAFGGNLNPNNLCMKLNDIDNILGCNLSPCGTLINNDIIMRSVATYIKDRLDKDNMSNKNMRDLIDRLPQFEDIVING